jgi:hypothetical protein
MKEFGIAVHNILKNLDINVNMDLEILLKGALISARIWQGRKVCNVKYCHISNS